MPSYTPTLIPHLHLIHTANKPRMSLGVIALHTPGHTPDELALYDQAEGMLYVGDTLYEHERIIFPNEGSITIWFSSMDFLISFVRNENDRLRREATFRMMCTVEKPGVLINAGHETVLRPALEVLQGAKDFIKDVVEGREPIKRRKFVRGEEHVEYDQESGQFALRCPKRLVIDAQNVCFV